MPSCAQRLTVLGDTWRSSATCAVRRYLGWVVWGNALSRSCCRPRFGDDPMPVGVGCHRAFYTGWPSSSASRCRLVPQPVPSWTLTSLSLLAWSFASHLPQGRPRKQLAGTAIVVLGGMPGHPVVTSSGRRRYCAPGRGARSASQPAGRACPLATGASVGSALVGTSKTVEGGTST
jgi:hypothetical protein